ncbi:MAG: ParM/StbA family protein [Firmicutes bacterium]|nr:ParM/StbA family protein [Bacillota bacterium]
MKVLSVDPGKKYNKYATIDKNGEIKVDSFPTRYTKLTELNNVDIVGKDSFLVEYNGEKLIVGAQGELDSLDKRTKMTELHKLATLTAITQMLKDFDEDEIILINNIPGSTYKSSKAVEQYTDYYTQDEEISIEVDGKSYNFRIKEVEFLPEGAGFYFRYPELCIGTICVIDIGGYNIGLTAIKDGAIMRYITLDFGGTTLENQVITKLEAKLDGGVDKNKIGDYIKDGYVKHYGVEVEGTRELIKGVKFEYISSFIKASAEKQVHFKDMDKLYFIGGNSLQIENEIMEHNLISKISQVMKDAKYINVIGNLLYGEEKYNGQ